MQQESQTSAKGRWILKTNCFTKPPGFDLGVLFWCVCAGRLGVHTKMPWITEPFTLSRNYQKGRLKGKRGWYQLGHAKGWVEAISARLSKLQWHLWKLCGFSSPPRVFKSQTCFYNYPKMLTLPPTTGAVSKSGLSDLQRPPELRGCKGWFVKRS